MTFEGLVPEDFGQFRSVKFWDGFFQKRKQKAFEWYGEWRQLQPLVWGACARPNNHILMLGCGNSDISAQMCNACRRYDAGCRFITNIDFSKVCIKEMLMKNLRQRPQMKWMVMDMTDLTFKDGSFHVAFDKGALDALMGEDTEEAGKAGSNLLSEVQRVLHRSEGHYLCVTLGQAHVLSKLLSTFGAGWDISIDRVPPSSDMASSPLQPLLVTVVRQLSTTGHCQRQQQDEVDGQVDDLGTADDDDDDDVGGAQDRQMASAVQLSFKPETGVVNSEQLADVFEIIEQENKLRASGGTRQQTSKQAAPTPAPAARPASSHFDQLRPGRRSVVALPQPEAHTSTRQTTSEDKDGGDCHPARFTAAVLDVDATAAKRAVRDCAVFIVPQGREHEWLFASPEGQGQVAQGCSAKRVIMVSLNRGHSFGSLKAVQGELSPLVMDLAPTASRQLEAAIPFMTTQEGIGSRTVLEVAESELTGSISIEDVTVQNDGAADKVLRRMVFTSNRNLVQSEAVLCSSTCSGQSMNGASATAGAERSTDAAVAGNGKKGKSKGKAVKQKGKSSGEGQTAEANGTQLTSVDHSQLACDYHKGIVAGLSLIHPNLKNVLTATAAAAAAAASLQTDSQQQQQQQQQLQQQSNQSEQSPAQGSQGQGVEQFRPQAMVVGLGGGGLPVFLNRHCHMDVQSVELDPVVVDLARRHFAFADTATLQARVGDGLEAVAQLAHSLSSGSAPHTQRSTSPHTEGADQTSASVSVSHDKGASQSAVSSDVRQGGHLDLLVVDAGSGDASVAMSCPPPAFLEAEFLGHAKEVLNLRGMLVVNCVSRAEEPYKAAVQALQAVFAEVYELDVDEDVNKVLFALPQPMQAQAQAPKVVGHIKRDKKGRPAKGGQLEKEVCADGSAGAVKLLTPRLNSSIQGISRHHLSEVEAMLPNLLLIK